MPLPGRDDVYAELGRLRERVAELEAIMAADTARATEEIHRIQLAIGVTWQQAHLLHLLSSGRLMQRDFLDRAIAMRSEGCSKTADVVVCKIRKTGLAVRNVWGQGYMLEGASLERVRAAMAGGAA